MDTNKENNDKVVVIDPQQNMFPATEDDLNQIISTEANYDRWANFLFPHSKSRDLYGRRKRSWGIELPDGEKSLAQIEVIPAQDEKCYTDRTYDVFLALVQIWYDKKMPDIPMDIYLGDVAKVLNLKENGRVATMILEELRCLEETKVSWVFSFQTKLTKQDTFKNLRLLDTFDYVQKRDRVKGHTKARCTIRFAEHIRNNLRNRVTIPVNFAARKKIRSSVAKTLYSRLDNILSMNSVHERTAFGLVQDLNMTKDRYLHKSQRKQLVMRLQKNMDGIPLSRPNLFLSVDVVETSDGEDWKCVFRAKNSSDTVSTGSNIDKSRIVNQDEDTIEGLINAITTEVGGRNQNYGLYRKYAMYYDHNLIHRAIGEYKEMIQYNRNIKEKERYFTAIIHTVAHKLGQEWIKDCGKNCKYRPENQFID